MDAEERGYIEQRCRTLIAALALPRILTMTRLQKAVEAYRGRRIILIPQILDDLELAGMTVPGLTADLVPYDTTATPYQQFHSVAHELGHLGLDHVSQWDPAGTEIAPPINLLELRRHTGDDQPLSELRAQIGRRATTLDEDEAEVFAQMVIALAQTPRYELVDVPTQRLDSLGETLLTFRRPKRHRL